MPAVGNDIVDLEAPGNAGKSRESRFVDRVFTEEERLLIHGAASPDRLLWLLWAAKEAAYKAVSRDDPAVGSIPRRYAVFLDGAEPGPGASHTAGHVITPKGRMALVVVATAQWVHALAGDIPPDGFRHAVAFLAGGEDPSVAARGNLLQAIGRHAGCPLEAFSILRDPDDRGAPRLLFRGSQLSVPFSLSHDGRFTAFAYDPASLLAAMRATGGFRLHA